MMLRTFISSTFMAIFLLALSSNAVSAQTGSAGVVAGAVQFDLSGTGTGLGAAPRLVVDLTDNLLVEGSFLIAQLNEDVEHTTFYAPEVQAQYQWRIGRWRPYAGAGFGFAVRDLGPVSDTDLTLSASAGARADLWERTGLQFELRLRGVELDFTGSTAEWLGGVYWRF